MPTTSRSRTIAATPERVWDVVADPHHLPRWWPKVGRVEGVTATGWTKVFLTQKGRAVRADFSVLRVQEPRTLAWSQELEDSPFERLMHEAVTEINLEPADADQTRVTLELRQRLRGWARFAPFLVKRGTRRLLDEALDGLERSAVR